MKQVLHIALERNKCTFGNILSMEYIADHELRFDAEQTANHFPDEEIPPLKTKGAT